MLCAACVWMFQDPSKKGIHHHSYDILVMAAGSGCKICLYILRLRERRGSDEVRERQKPFTTYNLSKTSSSIAFIDIQSKVSWLYGMWSNRIQLHISVLGSSPHWWLKYLEGVRRDLTSAPWTVRQDDFVTRTVAGNTGDPQVLDLANYWLDACRSQHEKCEAVDETRQLNYFPPRLIDVGNTKCGAIRLILSKDQSLTPEAKYATLSHCWGKNPSFVRLTTANMASLVNDIPPASLPKSFSDAIICCRYLGIRYLWIDSLCILQSGPGSEQDWQAHVGEMHVIYSNCTLNLSIAHASNPNEGAFVDRDASFIQTAHVYAPLKMGLHNADANPDDQITEESIGRGDSREAAKSWKCPGNSKTGLEDSSRPWDETQSCLVTIFTAQYDFSDSLMNQPLWKRGWVVQERLMAPRMLAFGSDRIYWRCHERNLNEYLPFGLPDSGEQFECGLMDIFNLPSDVLCSKPPLSLTGEELSMLHEKWYTLVSHYSDTSLTYPEKDKLSAIAAIAGRFNRVLSGKYCAGLFESDMPLGLLWMPTYAGSLEVDGYTFSLNIDHTRGPNYQAPTWSWASVNNWFLYNPFHYHRKSPETFDILASVERTSVHPKDPQNPFGQVVAGELVISGILIHLTAESLTCVNYSPETAESRKIRLGQELFGLCVVGRDIDLTTIDRTIIPMYELQGILLSRVEQDTYQRTGFFEVCDTLCGRRFPIQRYERQTIRIF